MYVLLALTSGLLFGVWKFGLGRFRGVVSPYSIVLVSAAAAAIVYLVFGGLTSQFVIDSADLLPSLLGGVLNLIGNLLIVEAFARGKLAVVTGVALTAVLVPLAYSFMIGESMATIAAVGIVFLLAGLLLFYLPDIRKRTETKNAKAAIALALIAALAWGLAIIVIDIGSRVSLPATMLISQLPQVAFTLMMIALVKRSWGGLNRSAVVGLAAAGVALGLANYCFFTAANEGDIGIVTVLSSLSTIVVALLAWIVLSERLSRSEVLALIVVLAGTTMIVM